VAWRYGPGCARAEELQNVPVILLSGSARLSARRRYWSTQGYIAKPFDIAATCCG
jgi:CheY-like chemotaxis protein